MKLTAYEMLATKLAAINKNIAAIKDELARAATAEDRAESEAELRVFKAARAKVAAELAAI